MPAVEAREISFVYDYEQDEKPAIDNLSFTIEKGEFVAVLGANGSGKSTLARHLNALLPLQTGTLSVMEIDAANEESIWELRRLCAMVFQNPDNQFVSSIVEEDVAFGLINYDTPEEEIPGRVHEALSLTGMLGYERRSPHTLSGGQKQRVAMAGVLAMQPEIIVFDEATSMLDPQGRAEVLDYLERLHLLGKTVVMITHYVEEAVRADRVILMKDGTIAADGTPREILTDTALLARAKLTPPAAVQIYCDLAERGIELAVCPLTNKELAEEICRLK